VRTGLLAGMRTTLERLRATAEGGAPASPAGTGAEGRDG
jgi:hypothetical protein